MAGSGKSLLTASLHEWLKARKQNVAVLNLDPGVENLPYNPDVDIRAFISLQDVMSKYQLGPNGALVMASDLIGDYLEEIRGEIEEISPDMLFVDTPGQIELFAFRESGPFIANSLSEEGKAILYLFDGPFCRNPLNYVSNLFLASAVHTRLLLPWSCAFTKTDLLSEEELSNLIAMAEDADTLSTIIQETMGGSESIVIRELAESMARAGLDFSPIPVSAKKNDGLIDLYAELCQSLLGGEEPSG